MTEKLLLVATALALTGCAPKRDLQADDINRLTKLGEVMDVQATLADPQFKKRDQVSFTDDELAKIVDAGNRLQVTALKAKQFSKGAGFDELATRLHDQAAALSSAAQGKDAAAVRKTLTDIKSTCKECHSKFR